MITDHILDQLSDVKKFQQGYRAACPAHDDEGRSLVIVTDLTDTNDVSIECTEGCDTDDLQSELSL